MPPKSRNTQEQPAAEEAPVTMADTAALNGGEPAAAADEPATVAEPDPADDAASDSEAVPIGESGPEPLTVDEPAAVRPFISEGMRHEIEVHGWAVDPNTGRKVTRDDLAR